MKINDVLKVAIYAGEILLSSGAEVYRVEETIEKICESYGYNVEAISTLTSIKVAYIDENKSHVIAKKVRKRQIDLHKIELVNNFSRSLQENKKDYEECMQELSKINNLNSFSSKLELIASALIPFNFAYFYGGKTIDALVAAFLGSVVYILRKEISQVGVYEFLENFFLGFSVGLLSYLSKHFISTLEINKILSGTIILLTPGLTLTNSLRDIVHGDYISGFSRFLEAVLIAVAIGFGVGLSILFFNSL